MIGKVDLAALELSLETEIAIVFSGLRKQDQSQAPDFAKPFAPKVLREPPGTRRTSHPRAVTVPTIEEGAAGIVDPTAGASRPMRHPERPLPGTAPQGPRRGSIPDDLPGATVPMPLADVYSTAPTSTLQAGMEPLGAAPSLVASAFESIRHVAGERTAPLNGYDLETLVGWSEATDFPLDADAFAEEVAWALRRYGTSTDLTIGAGVAVPCDEPEGRREAVEAVTAHKERLYRNAVEKRARDGYVRGIPWIVARIQFAVTKGGSTEEADRSIERFARMDGTSVPSMYDSLARRFGLRMETVDIVLWTAFAYGMDETR